MKNKKKIQKISRVVNGVIEEYRKGSPDTDPLGMYTGVSKVSDECVTQGQYAATGKRRNVEPEEEIPTQDADDL